MIEQYLSMGYYLKIPLIMIAFGILVLIVQSVIFGIDSDFGDASGGEVSSDTGADASYDADFGGDAFILGDLRYAATTIGFFLTAMFSVFFASAIYGFSPEFKVGGFIDYLMLATVLSLALVPSSKLSKRIYQFIKSHQKNHFDKTLYFGEEVEISSVRLLDDYYQGRLVAFGKARIKPIERLQNVSREINFITLIDSSLNEFELQDEFKGVVKDILKDDNLLKMVNDSLGPFGGLIGDIYFVKLDDFPK